MAKDRRHMIPFGHHAAAAIDGVPHYWATMNWITDTLPFAIPGQRWEKKKKKKELEIPLHGGGKGKSIRFISVHLSLSFYSWNALLDCGMGFHRTLAASKCHRRCRLLEEMKVRSKLIALPCSRNAKRDMYVATLRWVRFKNFTARNPRRHGFGPAANLSLLEMYAEMQKLCVLRGWQRRL